MKRKSFKCINDNIEIRFALYLMYSPLKIIWNDVSLIEKKELCVISDVDT